MTTNLELLRVITRFLERGNKVAFCTIIEKNGSAPRDIGAKMAVCEDGETIGTIGGGTLETALVNESLRTLGEGKPKRVTFSLHKGGGKETVETGLICGGELTIFIDVIEPEQKLIIIGAGDIAWALAKLANIIGFRMTIVDDHEELANKERFPMAERIITGDFTEALGKLEIGSSDAVVIVHGEPEHDYVALRTTIRKKPAYIGLLGSKTKVATFLNKLRVNGASEEDFKTICAPIGLDIGAQTPEEIGISILAEVISKKRKT